MENPGNYSANLSLAPLGAGDLIDRAVRFYRKNFWTFVLIATPPVVFGTLLSVGWTMLGRQLFAIDSSRYSIETTFYYLFIWLGSIVIWLAEMVATLVVMGGASRNFVRHLLFGEAIRFRETYVNAWTRFAGLVVASSIIAISISIAGFMFFYFGLIIGALAEMLVVSVLGTVPILAFLVSVPVVVVVTGGTLWLFFLVVSRFASVPQIMLVEGRGIFAAIGRSAGFSIGNVKRVAALFIFSTFAAYSALALLLIPLAWYASASGVEIMSFNSELNPAWYEIAYKLICQFSFILLSPVWTIGLCLLYVDERVRTEGYDIELMAAVRLGEIPSVPTTYINPLHPALANTGGDVPAPARTDRSSITTLGLK